MTDLKLVLLIASGVFIGQLAFAHRRLMSRIVLSAVTLAVYIGLAYVIGYVILRYLFNRPDVWVGWVLLLGVVMSIGLSALIADAVEWLRYRARPQAHVTIGRIWRFAAHALGATNRRD